MMARSRQCIPSDRNLRLSRAEVETEMERARQARNEKHRKRYRVLRRLGFDAWTAAKISQWSPARFAKTFPEKARRYMSMIQDEQGKEMNNETDNTAEQAT